MKEITSKDNPLFKHALKLQDKRRRDETGEYLAEGERLVCDLFEYGFAQDVRYILAERAVYDRYAATFARTDCFVIPPVLAEKLSGTEHGQGVFAVVRKPDPRPLSGRTVLLLDRVRDPGNVGTIVRTAAAFGVRDIVLLDCADAYAPKVVRSAMGCLAKVNLLSCGVEDVRAAGYAIVCADMAGEPIERYTRSEKICLVIGNEANGVAPEIRRAADGAVSVTMRGVESLNASVSAAILMYELVKQEE